MKADKAKVTETIHDAVAALIGLERLQGILLFKEL